MWPSVFERLELIMNGCLFHLNEKQANITKTGNLSQRCDFIMRVSIATVSSIDKYFVNIVKIILWKNFHDQIHN